MPTNGPPPKDRGPQPVSPPPPPARTALIVQREPSCDMPAHLLPARMTTEPPPDFLNGEHKRAFEALRQMCIAMHYAAPGFVMGWPECTWPDGFEIVQSSSPPKTMISMRLDRFEEIVAALRNK